MLEGFVAGFIVFAVFFELMLDLSHLGAGELRGTVGAAVLIFVGRVAPKPRLTRNPRTT